ncbi:MAG: hypothetical protein COZ06_35885 [Armatimonadetes bacterium CG_4_10_14_3_um_filter_66_18]|nr:DUF2283 domain-containing protein [Armatimonadota bacterium]OIO94277.1 MAG: hypothetical protein AUJ96_28920 [Armatimonadetes bacterium CG2_30_66_41]PIU93199.1 MAG: hypothetical protein COS65_13915 [Armatimonadetes bacterium CG06_land_8_20_14_3_00_66_21]PIX38689.1 MAG: hypothetical protein COZ57_29945 [Armatimonadetes bacterium CG_4_8_14_3_um_filter_66_20]PIY36544.1 MAG: hypothetical protein COZ06_35885 [Armatimonadetes bacterium CG_4_10_14_3_um_filter_66_18]PIZ35295.1 MAG: hypothetical pro
MAAQSQTGPVVSVSYDQSSDILTFAFTPKPQPAVAEEAGDEVWVRYDPLTRHVVTVEVLNLGARVQAAFGPSLRYSERVDPDRLQAVHGLVLEQG